MPRSVKKQRKEKQQQRLPFAPQFVVLSVSPGPLTRVRSLFSAVFIPTRQ
jgi:hypothetical protein